MLHLSQLIMYTMFFWFTYKLVCDGVSPACGIIADKSVGAFYELVLHRLLLQGALSPGVGGVGVFTSARTRCCHSLVVRDVCVEGADIKSDQD